MKLKYDDYCDYYANKCTVCRGQKFIDVDGICTCCICQHTATVKWRLEQFDIYPPELKYKTWDDFVGSSADGQYRLTDASFHDAKSKALKYCFGSDDPNNIKMRDKKLCVDSHLVDGQNVIISGPSNSGKTLIAVLIIKEVAFACRTKNLNINFKCVKSNALKNAARWDNDKPIDHVFLDELEETDFLVVDGVDILRGGHNNPPDLIAINSLFDYRINENLPTIVICSDQFMSDVRNPTVMDIVVRQWGDSFISMLRNPSNVFIDLKKINEQS